MASNNETPFNFPPPEIQPSAQLLSSWSWTEKSEAHSAKMDHNHEAGNPASQCDGKVEVTMLPGSLREKICVCARCKELVIIDLAILGKSLGKNNFVNSLQTELPEEYREGLRKQVREHNARD